MATTARRIFTTITLAFRLLALTNTCLAAELQTGPLRATEGRTEHYLSQLHRPENFGALSNTELPIGSQSFRRALIALNSASARSNLSLNSHMESRISRKLADVLARSVLPKVKMLLLRRYPITVGSEIL
jgi:hypothetical protein